MGIVSQTDFTVQNAGSILILYAETPEAEAWVEDHLPDDAQHWAGGVVIEPRYFDPIAVGIEADGLTIN